MLQDRTTPAVFLAQHPGTQQALAGVTGGAGLPLAGVGVVVALLVLVLAGLLLVRSRRPDGAAGLAEPDTVMRADSRSDVRGTVHPAAAPPAAQPLAPSFFSDALAADLLPSRPAGRGLRRSGATRRPPKRPAPPTSAAPEASPATVLSSSPPSPVPRAPVFGALPAPQPGPSEQPAFGAAPVAQRVLDAAPAAAEVPSVFGAVPLPAAEPVTWSVPIPEAPPDGVDISSLFRRVPLDADRAEPDDDRAEPDDDLLAAPTSWACAEPVTLQGPVQHLAPAPATADDIGDVLHTGPVPTLATAPPAPGSSARPGSDVRSMLGGRSQRL